MKIIKVKKQIDAELIKLKAKYGLKSRSDVIALLLLKTSINGPEKSIKQIRDAINGKK
jgi:hypothetical protein